MADTTYDAIVIGGGPGGYVAAIRLGQLGLKTLCVEKEHMGGVCLNWGCIPSKALIAASGLAERVRHAEVAGIEVSGLRVDVGKMQKWKDGIVKKLTGGVRGLLKANGAEIAMGTARLAGPDTVRIESGEGSRTVRASRGIIVATGASVLQIPGFAPDGERIITAKEAVSLESAPETMVVIGGGVIGLELGMVYQKLGTRLIVVEMMDQLLPGIDADLVRVVQKKLVKGGAEVLLGARARDAQVAGDKVAVAVEVGGEEKRYEADRVLVAVGFRANSGEVGLDAAGVAVDERGNIVIDETMQTNVPGIYAIGDVTGPPFLAHRASKQGEIAAEVIAGHKSAADWEAMPAAVFTDPEIATVGLSEREAKDAGREVRVGKFPFAASGRAMSVLETDGFIKVIVDPADNRLLGLGIVGPEASDLISEGALALEMCAFAEDVALTIHPHPTLGEGMMEAFKHALGEAIHVLNR